MNLAQGAPTVPDLVEAPAIGIQFDRRHGLAVGLQEEALDNNGSNPSRLQQVAQDSVEAHRTAVNVPVVLFGARVELGPNLSVMSIHERHPPAHGDFVQASRVGDEHDLGLRESFFPQHVGHDFHAHIEIGDHRRFAIAAEGHIADDSAHLGRGVIELGFKT